MKPILYYDDLSPPVRSVLMLIKELDIDVDLSYINLFQCDHLAKEFLDINPAHTVPAMKHNDLILTDSQAILIYLTELYGKNTELYSDELMQRSKILNRLFFNSSLLFRRDSDVMTEIFMDQITDISAHEPKIDEAYEMLEKYLETDKFMVGNHMTIADISIVATLSTLDILKPVTNEKLPQLYNWFKTMKKLPYYVTANQIGLDKLKVGLKEFGNFDLI